MRKNCKRRREHNNLKRGNKLKKFPVSTQGFFLNILFSCGVKEEDIYDLASKCFDFTFRFCSTVGTIPFERTPGGRVTRVNPPRLVWHHALYFSLVIVLASKILGSLHFLRHETSLNSNSVVPILVCTLMFIILSLSTTTVVKSWDAIAVIQSWTSLLVSVDLKENCDAFRDFRASVEVITMVTTAVVVAIVGSAASLLFDTIPIFFFTWGRNLGIITFEGHFQELLWKLACFLLEMLFNVSLLLLSAFGCQKASVGVSVHSIFLTKMRCVYIAIIYQLKYFKGE